MSITSANQLLDDLLSHSETREKNGYTQVFLEGEWQWLHRVIAIEKMGSNINEGFEVHHIDGDKHNNHPDNLKVLSKEEHMALHEKARQQNDGYKEERVRKYISERIQNLEKKRQKNNSIISDNLNKMLKNMNLRREHDRYRFLNDSDSFDHGYPEDDFTVSVCIKCGGNGYLPEYNHVEAGVCFTCGGSGYS